MTEIYHYFWALLPFLLLVSGVRGYWRKTFQGGKRDYPTEFLKQFAFCTILLAISIAVDRFYFDDLFAAVTLDLIDPRIPRWLTYPGLLLLVASVQNYFKKRRDEEERAAMTARQRRYAQRGY